MISGSRHDELIELRRGQGLQIDRIFRRSGRKLGYLYPLVFAALLKFVSGSGIDRNRDVSGIRLPG